jgi:hypothetical protein
LETSDLLSILRTIRCATDSESELSSLVFARLVNASLVFRAEVWLNDSDRIDYLVGRVGVELKVKGAVNSVARQLQRYAQSDQIDELILVTTKRLHSKVPLMLSGKMVHVITVGAWM